MCRNGHYRYFSNVLVDRKAEFAGLRITFSTVPDVIECG